MAGNLIVINSKFKPFSYQEMLHPVMLATQAHQDLETQYGDLNAKASIWENRANQQTDPLAYSMYKKYADDLKLQADILATRGLNPTSKQNMLKMKTRYASEITPIEEAYTKRVEQSKEQNIGRANGIIYEGDAATTSLDDYIKNPSLQYKFANSKEGFTRVATAAQALSKTLNEYGKGKSLDGFTRTWLQQHGYRDTEVAQAINDIQQAIKGVGNIKGQGILQEILVNEMNTAGVNNWKNKAAQMDYYNRVAPALYQSVGQTDIQAYTDQAAVMNAQEAMNKRNLERQTQAQKDLINYQMGVRNRDQMKMYNQNRGRLFTENELREKGKSIEESTQKWIEAGYLTKTGQLTQKGLNEINKQSSLDNSNTPPIYGSGGGKFGMATASLMRKNEFATFVKERMGITKFDRDNLIQGVNKYYRDFQNDKANLVYGIPNFGTQRLTIGSKETQDDLKGRILNAIGEKGGIYSLGNGLDENKKIKKGAIVSYSNLQGELKNNPITYLTNIPSTGQQLIELQNGKRYFLPKGVLGEEMQLSLDQSNYKMRMNENNPDYVANESNNAFSYLASILTTNVGEKTKPSDGTFMYQFQGIPTE